MNIIQRVGGSIGTALLAVLLEQNIASSVPSTGGSISSLAEMRGTISVQIANNLAEAFSETFWVAVVITTLTFIPAIFLLKRVQQPDAQDVA